MDEQQWVVTNSEPNHLPASLAVLPCDFLLSARGGPDLAQHDDALLADADGNVKRI
jgi:hypothetical protein